MITFERLELVKQMVTQLVVNWFLHKLLKKTFKLIETDLGKQQAVDADPKAIQQMNFTGKLNWAGDAAMFFIIEEAKVTVLDFSQGNINALYFNITPI